jgi:antitoxin VapB
MPQKTARLFANGRSQAVRLPAGFRFEGDEVYIRRDDETGDVILSPIPQSWEKFFALRAAAARKAEGFLLDRGDRLPQARELFSHASSKRARRPDRRR